MNGDHFAREAILAVADAVHAQARSLIHLHNKVERAQNSFSSIIKSFFGSHVPFHELAREATEMVIAWRRVLSEVTSTGQRLDSIMSGREREYLQLIRMYADANATTAALLAERQTTFCEASKSARRSTLTYAATKDFTRRYNDSMVECQRLFEDLRHATFNFLSPANA